MTYAHDLLQRVWLLDVAGSTSSVQFSSCDDCDVNEA